MRPPQLFSAAFRESNNSDAASATAAAAAQDTPVAVRECPSHPTPARGSLRRAYYPSGACLVYRNVARALCAAGDLVDRQRNDEMGPGGSTHHLLSFAVSGEPRWTPERRLHSHDDSGEGEEERQRARVEEESARVNGTNVEVNVSTANKLSHHARNAAVTAAPPTHWSTAALARVVLWKNRLSSLRDLKNVPIEVWDAWETKVLATTFHADVTAAVKPLGTSAAEEVAAAPSLSSSSLLPSSSSWSAAQLLARRGFLRARDVWRRGSPASQRSLAATANNGRYLCIMASVGPYRKLVNPREPLRDVKGFYACAVFDTYAGAVLRVIPICPVDPSGLHGVNMHTSEQHELDLKMPLYRLQCSVTIVPIAATPNVTDASFQSDDTSDTVEPKELVALTIGGLANTVYIYDALNGRRIACSRDVEQRCGAAAAAAHEASQAAHRPTLTQTTATATKAAAAVEKTQGSHSTAAASQAQQKPVSPAHTPAVAVVPASSLSPSSICTPADVLASVATWGRGTGFDGITDRSSSSSSTVVSSSSDVEGLRPSGIHNGRASVLSTMTVVTPVPAACSPSQRTTTSSTHVAAAQRAVSDAVAREDGALPRLLQGEDAAAARSEGDWRLRKILGLFHRRQKEQRQQRGTSASLSSPAGVARTWTGENDHSSESDWEAEGAGESSMWEWQPPLPLQQQQQQQQEQWMNGRAGKANGKMTTRSQNSSGFTVSRPFSLYAVYQTLLGCAPSAGLRVDQANGQSSTPVPPHAAVWQQQRRRLLERVLRHYDVDLLWQAYVALFATATTSTHGVAPQSAVAALVAWAQQTTRIEVTAVRRTGMLSSSPAASTASWVWCATRRRSSGACGPVHMSHSTQCVQQGARDDGENRNGKRETAAGCTAQEVAHSIVPFARVLQQREDLMWELQELEEATQVMPAASATRSERTQSSSSPSRPSASLLAQMRTQAMLDGSLPPSPKLLFAQHRDAAATSAQPTVKFPLLHHQNQLRLDVVNAVATWMDANGGFYICFGSEDGGLYLLGGSVAA
ncbi:hypothetical protein N2W54_003057 [Lotmaria passim]